MHQQVFVYVIGGKVTAANRCQLRKEALVALLDVVGALDNNVFPEDWLNGNTDRTSVFGVDDTVIQGRSLRLSDNTINTIEGVQKLIYALEEVSKDDVAILILGAF